MPEGPLFFTGETASQSYLYVTDGTQAGTIQLASGVGDNGMFYVGNKCLINSGGDSLGQQWNGSGHDDDC